MSEFNNKSRMSNALKTSIVGGITNIIKIILGFGYRTIFLFILSEVYLGINGLFTNILQIFSLTELGVTTAIVYRFYDPIGRGDKQYVGMLMNFFKRVYLTIAGVILGLGVAIMPFMKFLINYQKAECAPQETKRVIKFKNNKSGKLAEIYAVVMK